MATLIHVYLYMHVPMLQFPVSTCKRLMSRCIHVHTCTCTCVLLPISSLGVKFLQLVTCFSDPGGGTVVDGVLLVVDGGIVPDKVEILLQLLQGGVLPALHLLTHGGKVHGVTDDVQVVRHLQVHVQHTTQGQ